MQWACIYYFDRVPQHARRWNNHQTRPDPSQRKQRCHGRTITTFYYTLKIVPHNIVDMAFQKIANVNRGVWSRAKLARGYREVHILKPHKLWTWFPVVVQRIVRTIEFQNTFPAHTHNFNLIRNSMWKSKQFTDSQKCLVSKLSSNHTRNKLGCSVSYVCLFTR